MCSTYSKLFALQRPVVKYVLTLVTFPFLFLICNVYSCWRASAFLSVTALRLRASKGTEDSYNGVWIYLSTSYFFLAYWCTSWGEIFSCWLLGPCVFPLCSVLWSPMAVMQQQSKPTKPGATAVFHNPEHEHSGVARTVKQLCRLPTPNEFDVAPQSMERRTLWEPAFVLIRIAEILVCFFFWSLSSMGTCAEAGEYSFD